MIVAHHAGARGDVCKPCNGRPKTPTAEGGSCLNLDTPFLFFWSPDSPETGDPRSPTDERIQGDAFAGNCWDIFHREHLILMITQEDAESSPSEETPPFVSSEDTIFYPPRNTSGVYPRE